MIAKINRGGNVAGLMYYLVGPGRQNEHETPHLVAGSAGLMAWYSTDVLGSADAGAIGRHLDQPRTELGTIVEVPVKAYDDAAGEKVEVDRRPAHVWHCSLSLPPTTPDGAPGESIGDEAWGAIAAEFVEAMDFAGADAGAAAGAGGKAPCRWAAVHHGATTAGGDHIHLVVQLVREDGTKASTQWDYKRASRAVANLEQRHGLEIISGRAADRSARPELRAETEQAVRLGQPESYSAALARRVRACATSAASEDEFVRRCRGEGLWVRPRFQAGGHDVVEGWSVAQAPPDRDTRPVWKGGGQLGRDLTLPRLRETWADTPEAAQAAVEEWRAAWRGAEVTTAGRETQVPSERLWETYRQDLERLNRDLTQVDPTDRATWARVARETSGVLAAWSVRTEATPGPLAAASDELATASAVHARVLRDRTAAAGQGRRGRSLSLRGPAYLLMQLAAGPNSATGQALLIRQVANTIRALRAAQIASGQAREAARVAQMYRDRLTAVAAALPDEPLGEVLNAALSSRVSRPSPLGPDFQRLDEPAPAATLGAPRTHKRVLSEREDAGPGR